MWEENCPIGIFEEGTFSNYIEKLNPPLLNE